MPYNERLAERVRQLLHRRLRIEEKKMMGGLTFMVNGKMCVGILNDDLMARIDPEEHTLALARKGCREMDFTGRPMRGFIFVGPEGTRTGAGLAWWLRLALSYNARAKPSRKRKR